MNNKILADTQVYESYEKKINDNISPGNANGLKSSKMRNENLKALARKIYDLRHKRDQFFHNGLFSDPAWDIILDLYISEADQKEISITSACIAAGVPASTGLRWITILIQNGHVERYEDSTDARRSFLRLTPSARDSLEALLSQFCTG